MPPRNKPITAQLLDAIHNAEKRGITRYVMAQRCGLSQAQLSRIVMRGSIPKLDTAQKICEAIDCKLTIQYLP